MDAAEPPGMPRAMRTRRRCSGFALAAGALVALLALPSCHPGGRHGAVDWVASCAVPRFDPDGPPNDVRWAIERLLSFGLTSETESGRIEGAAADRYQVSPDGLAWTFHLRSGLRFTDGKPCTSADFRAALAAGLARGDHGVHAALLGALRGLKPARAGRRRTPLGIETPDARTLILRLDHPDSLLPAKLALPGVGVPWRSRLAGEWSAVVGLGPYRLARAEGGVRLVLARASGPGPDSVRVRFVIGVARLRDLLRAARADLLWPLPPELLDQTLPAGYRLEKSEARPRRRLLLVMRADTPPTTQEAARRALAHGVNKVDVLATLGRAAAPSGELVSGAGPFPLPRYDATEVASWMAKGNLGRSFHITLLYDADRSGATVAQGMQSTWSRQSIDVELQGVRGNDFVREALNGREQVLLAEWQPLESGAAFEALGLLGASRGLPCGAFRTGWRPADAAQLRGGGQVRPVAPATLEGALERDLVVLPLADLPWVRLVREGGPAAPFHPHFGPDFGATEPAAPIAQAGEKGAASH
jgi:ABC-type transport system substrate-binding protein